MRRPKRNKIEHIINGEKNGSCMAIMDKGAELKGREASTLRQFQLIRLISNSIVNI